MITSLSSRSSKSSEDMNYGKKLRNHSGEVMKDAATRKFREDISHIPERSMEGCLEEVAFNMDLLRE